MTRRRAYPHSSASMPLHSRLRTVVRWLDGIARDLSSCGQLAACPAAAPATTRSKEWLRMLRLFRILQIVAGDDREDGDVRQGWGRDQAR